MRDDPQQVDHGRRLSSAEYQQRIVALQSTLPPMPTRDQDRTARRAALDLAIDHRLGVDFPRERRDALFAAQERVERGRLWILLRQGLKRIIGSWREKRGREQGARGLAHFVVDEYAKILSKDELEAFFGREEASSPTLPDDRARRS